MQLDRENIMSVWARDTVERLVSTFVETFLAIVVAAGTDHFDLSTIKAAGVAGVAAVFAVIKAAIASRKAQAISPASLTS